MTSVKGDILSAFSSTTRRVLGGAAISAVLLGAGTGMAFADIDNSGAGSPVFGDQSNNGLAGDGGDGAASGDATGGAGGDDGDAGGAESGAGGAGGAGGSIGANSPTQNANNQQQISETNQDAASVGGDGDGTGAGGDGGDIAQGSENNFAASSVQQGAGSTAGVMDAAHPGHEGHAKTKSGADCDASTSYHESKGFKKSSHESEESHDSASYSSGDNTPVGAADTGDGSFVNAAGMGEEIALGGAISAAALLGAYGISIARRRQAAHAGV